MAKQGPIESPDFEFYTSSVKIVIEDGVVFMTKLREEAERQKYQNLIKLDNAHQEIKELLIPEINPELDLLIDSMEVFEEEDD